MNLEINLDQSFSFCFDFDLDEGIIDYFFEWRLTETFIHRLYDDLLTGRTPFTGNIN